MDWCAGCGPVGPIAHLCEGCRRRLAAAPERRLPGGLLVRGAWRHDGPARRMVLLLKYQAVAGAAALLAAAMAARLPPEAAMLVPVPRARVRAWRHGIDPAVELARALGAATGLPVRHALRPAWWWPRHAGVGRAGRSPPRFRVGATVERAVLVDDVLTTGATLEAAARVFGPRVIGAVTATVRGVW